MAAVRRALPRHGAVSFQSTILLEAEQGLNWAVGIFRHHKEDRPMWTKPAFTDLRIGFEVTMYFANR